jgi:GNAT superfamily N-acetyltransferase
MGLSDAPRLPDGIAARPLAAADLPGALALVEEAHWNQVAADWRIFLDFGAATALTDSAGRLVATAAILPHSGRFGWISMVLVTTAWRRRGLARWLLGEAVAKLEARGLAALLDATPAGRAVYLGLGFRDTWGLTRLVRSSPSLRGGEADEATQGRAHNVPGSGLLRFARNDGIVVRPLRADDWSSVLADDEVAFGGGRAPLLRHLAERLPDAALVAERDGRPAGFLFGRDGRVMQQLGPLVTEDESVAGALLARAVSTVSGPLAIDLADRHAALAGWLMAQGFAAERPFTRMVRGAPGAFADPARYVAIAGPELG